MQPNDDIHSLAAAIGGDPLDEAAIQQLESSQLLSGAGKGSSDSTSQEGQAAQPVISQEGDPEEPDPDAKDKDSKDAKPPELTLESLLSDPKMGPQFQAWADRAAAAQVSSALNREREQLTKSAQAGAQDQAFDKYIKNLSREELGELLAEDEEFAVDYSNWRARQQTANLDPEAIASASQTFAYAAQVATFDRLLSDSDLPDDKRAELDGNKFTHLGPDGIVAWGTAIWTSLIEHETSKSLQAKYDESWEAVKQERLAELDKEPPPMVNGRRTSGTLDLLTTPSEDLMERALSKLETTRK